MMRSMGMAARRNLTPLASVLACLLAETSLFASLTGISASPYPPTFGNLITYTALRSTDDPPVNHYVWEYRCVSCGTGNWITAPGQSQSIAFYETRLGTWEIRCTAYYNPISNPNLHPNPPAPSSVTRSVTFNPPDGFNIIAGDKTPCSMGMSTPLTCKLQITQGGNACGPYISGNAQERYPAPNPNVGWVPDPPPSNEYYIQGNTIVDLHICWYPWDQWTAIPLQGLLFGPTTIEVRLLADTCCGTKQVCNLGSWTIRRRKVSPTQWQNEVVGHTNGP